MIAKRDFNFAAHRRIQDFMLRTTKIPGSSIGTCCTILYLHQIRNIIKENTGESF